MPYTHTGPRLWRTADDQLVPDGDSRAAFLLVAPGQTISDDEARRYGLGGTEKAELPKPNKARRGGPENKAVQ